LNIGREKVLTRNGNAHLEDGTQECIVGGRTAGAVLGADDNGKIVYYFIHDAPQCYGVHQFADGWAE
jgi:hypothetical protein